MAAAYCYVYDISMCQTHKNFLKLTIERVERAWHLNVKLAAKTTANLSFQSNKCRVR